MNYYVVNTCPTNNGKRIETAHLGVDMILRCNTYEEAHGYCKTYAHEMVKNDPDMRVYSFDENQPGGGFVEVLKREWIEEENEYCDIIYASFCVFAIDHFFAGGNMDCITRDGKWHHSNQ